MQWAVDLTERHAALRAACRLLGGLLAGVIGIDLVEVATTLGRRPLVRHGLGRAHELQHLLGHGISFQPKCEILLRKKRADRAKAAFRGMVEHVDLYKSI